MSGVRSVSARARPRSSPERNIRRTVRCPDARPPPAPKGARRARRTTRQVADRQRFPVSPDPPGAGPASSTAPAARAPLPAPAPTPHPRPRDSRSPPRRIRFAWPNPRDHAIPIVRSHGRPPGRRPLPRPPPPRLSNGRTRTPPPAPRRPPGDPRHTSGSASPALIRTGGAAGIRSAAGRDRAHYVSSTVPVCATRPCRRLEMRLDRLGSLSRTPVTGKRMAPRALDSHIRDDAFGRPRPVPRPARRWGMAGPGSNARRWPRAPAPATAPGGGDAACLAPSAPAASDACVAASERTATATPTAPVRRPSAPPVRSDPRPSMSCTCASLAAAMTAAAGPAGGRRTAP